MPKQRKFTEKSRLLEKKQEPKSIELVETSHHIFKIFPLFEHFARNPDKNIYLVLRTLGRSGKFYLDCIYQYQIEKKLPQLLMFNKFKFPDIPADIRYKFSNELIAKINKWQNLHLEPGKEIFPTKVTYEQIDRRLKKIQSSQNRDIKMEDFNVLFILIGIMLCVALSMTALFMLFAYPFNMLTYAKHQYTHINTTSPSNATYITTTTDSESLVPKNSAEYDKAKHNFHGTVLATIIVGSLFFLFTSIIIFLKCYYKHAASIKTKQLNHFLENKLEDPEVNQNDPVAQNKKVAWGITRFSRLFTSNLSENSSDVTVENLDDDNNLMLQFDDSDESSELRFEV